MDMTVVHADLSSNAAADAPNPTRLKPALHRDRILIAPTAKATEASTGYAKASARNANRWTTDDQKTI